MPGVFRIAAAGCVPSISADRQRWSRELTCTRRSVVLAFLACLIAAACGAPPTSPSPFASATASALASRPGSFGLVSPAPPGLLAAGTACGVSGAAGPLVSAAPQPTGPAVMPAWSAQATGSALTSLAFSPDGQLLATSAGDVQSTDTSAQLWTVGGAKVAMLVGHRAPVTCLAWSPDGQLVASGSRDGSVRLWNRSGRLVRTLAGNDPVVSLAWSPDGSLLAAGASDYYT